MADAGALPLLPFIVALPLLVAMMLTMLSTSRWQVWISAFGAVLQVGVVILILLTVEGAEETYRYTLAGWGAPLGIDLTHILLPPFLPVRSLVA